MKDHQCSAITRLLCTTETFLVRAKRALVDSAPERGRDGEHFVPQPGQDGQEAVPEHVHNRQHSAPQQEEGAWADYTVGAEPGATAFVFQERFAAEEWRWHSEEKLGAVRGTLHVSHGHTQHWPSSADAWHYGQMPQHVAALRYMP